MVGQDLKNKALDFLYSQVSQGKIPQIKKGMVEDLEKFVTDIVTELQISKTIARMEQKKEAVVRDVETQNEEAN